jgi:non-specific serine/threonine protein kinase
VNSENTPIELGLAPEGHLYLIPSESVPPEFEKIQTQLAKDPIVGLLHLGLYDFAGPLSSTFLFWQSFARQFITRVCKSSRDNQKIDAVPIPGSEEFQTILAGAPFMRGSEYFSEELLSTLWSQLEKALHRELEHFSGNLQDYLGQYNARWNLVGRVCFHLAENKNNEHLPFAFLATYTTQLSHGSSAQHLPLKKALQGSVAEKTSLLSLLTPVQKCASLSPFIKHLVDSGTIFEAAAWSIKEAHQFLQDIPLMEMSGVVVRVPNWWAPQQRPRLKAEVSIGSQPQSMLSFNNLCDFNVQLAIGGEPLTEEEWLALQERTESLVKIKGQWVEIDREKLKSVLSHWNQFKKATKNGLSISEAFRLLAGMNQSKPSDSIVEWSDVKPGAWLKTVLEQLQNPQCFSTVKLENLQGTLRPYQAKGVQWLWTLYQLKLGGCLADDMGLGKTVQVLALLLAIKELPSSGKPHLLILPASLLGNWQAEAAKFAPTLKIGIAHSSVKECDLLSADLVLTTYTFIHRSEHLREIEWDLVILDEAQAIKNPSSKQARVVKTLKSNVRIALTGTPVENRLSDLWSLFDFISPGLLGSGKEFSSYAKKGGKDQAFAAYTRFITAVRKLTQPYILRRLKSDKSIISDLPDKTEMKTYCSLSKEQVQLYTEVIQSLAKKLKSSDGIQRRGLILSSLMRLKQICNHPDQLQGFGEYAEQASGKMIRLREICEPIAEKQERVLLFTQFTEIIQPLFLFLTQIFGREGLILHGGTPVAKRAELVESFQQNQGPPFFILSLKAGGTGLNLTKASHVIHFDRWWNPAVENQATDRAYRIGQKHPVLVHQFICQGTIEEKIDGLIDSKKNISKELLEGAGELLLTECSNEQVMQMVSIDIHRALGEE